MKAPTQCPDLVQLFFKKVPTLLVLHPCHNACFDRATEIKSSKRQGPLALAEVTCYYANWQHSGYEDSLDRLRVEEGTAAYQQRYTVYT